MKWKELGSKALNILKGIAPVAASALGGPYAGAAMSIIAKATGVSEEKVESFILSASPQDLLKLRQAEMDLEKWREEANIQLEELEMKDRVNARDLAKDRGLQVQAALTALFIGGYFWLIYLFFTEDVVQDLSEFSKGQLGILIGILSAAVPQILAFWFGSSRGSKEKSDAMSKAVKPA